MVTASIVTYRTPLDEIDKVLACLRASEVSRVYIVDNARDAALEQHLRGDGFVEYIASDNVGYGAGHNQGIRCAIVAGAEYHLVLNSDIYWQGDPLGACLEHMRAHTDIGHLMPRIVYPDGRLQPQAKLLPTPVDLLLRRFMPARWGERRRRKYELEFTGYDHEMNVPYLCGCFMLFRVSALRDVGIFDERFFMYPEDIDITRRIHRKYRTVYFPGATITHVYATTSRKNMRMFMIHARNMIKYFNKWGWVFDSERRAFNSRLIDEEKARL